MIRNIFRRFFSPPIPEIHRKETAHYVYTGALLHHIPHGLGKLEFKGANTISYEGKFVHGDLPRGKISVNGNLAYAGELKNSKPHGLGIAVLRDRKTGETKLMQRTFFQGVVIAVSKEEAASLDPVILASDFPINLPPKSVFIRYLR